MIPCPVQMYFVSKTLAEQAAWKFAQENGIDFITIIPTLVVGPFLIPTMPPSLVTSLSPITGIRSLWRTSSSSSSNNPNFTTSDLSVVL